MTKPLPVEQLIDRLGAEVMPAKPFTPPCLFALAIAGGGAGALLVMTTLLGLNPALHVAVHDPFFWIKLLFCIGIAGFGLWGCYNAAIPGRQSQLPARGLALVGTVLLGLALQRLGTMPWADWPAAVYQPNALICLVFVTVCGLPTLLTLHWAMRRLAPTQLRHAGWMAGMAAAGVGAMAYALHCPNQDPLYVLCWYGLAMLITAQGQQLLASKSLRW